MRLIIGEHNVESRNIKIAKLLDRHPSYFCAAEMKSGKTILSQPMLDKEDCQLTVALFNEWRNHE